MKRWNGMGWMDAMSKKGFFFILRKQGNFFIPLPILHQI